MAGGLGEEGSDKDRAKDEATSHEGIQQLEERPGPDGAQHEHHQRVPRGVEVPNSEGCTEVGEEKEDKVIDPGKAYDAATRSENIEAEEAEFESIVDDKLLEDVGSEDGSNDTAHGTTRPNKVDGLSGNSNIDSKEYLGGADNAVDQAHGDAAHPQGRHHHEEIEGRSWY